MVLAVACDVRIFIFTAIPSFFMRLLSVRWNVSSSDYDVGYDHVLLNV